MTEAMYLQGDEIRAVLAMGGVKTLFCFQEITAGDGSQEALLSASCKLMADGLMTQIDGTYRLRRDLFDVLHPISQATHALVLTPADPQRDQVILYVGPQLSALRRTAFGGFYLQAMTREEVPGYLAEQLGAELSEAPTRADREPGTFRLDTSVEVLLKDGDFLLEQVCMKTGQRQSWLRCVQWNFFPWLEACTDTGVTTEPMTEEAWNRAMEVLTEGANKG